MQQDKQKLNEALTRGVDKIYPSKEELKERMEQGPMRLYLGVDPTGPHLHFGHATNLLTLKRFQELGHEVVLLIGDFTARIGDPTDKEAARTALTKAEVKENMKTFKRQVDRILPLTGKNKVKIRYNSKWFSKMGFEGVVELMSKVTHSQLKKRDMFRRREERGDEVHGHELLYPLMQGYDSVALDVDLEVGGTDQTFNMLMGRDLLKKYKDKEKFVLTTKLLEHPETGKKLMNKSEGGMINLDDSAKDIFGKVMALDDIAMFPLARYSTEMPLSRVAELEAEVESGSMNPRDAKLEVAEAAVALVHGEGEAKSAREEFMATFSEGDIAADDLPALRVAASATVLDIVLASRLRESKTQARQLIEQGGVSIADEKKTNPAEELELSGGEVIKIGKKDFFRVDVSG